MLAACHRIVVLLALVAHAGVCIATSDARADVGILDAAASDASLRSRLHQLHAIQQRRAAVEAESTANTDEDDGGLATMLASAASLSRFRGYAARSAHHQHAGGDDVVASETAKANAKIEADKRKSAAAAKQASQVRKAKEKFAECMEKCDEEKAEAETGVKINYCQKWSDYFCGCFLARGGACSPE